MNVKTSPPFWRQEEKKTYCSFSVFYIDQCSLSCQNHLIYSYCQSGAMCIDVAVNLSSKAISSHRHNLLSATNPRLRCDMSVSFLATARLSVLFGLGAKWGIALPFRISSSDKSSSLQRTEESHVVFLRSTVCCRKRVEGYRHLYPPLHTRVCTGLGKSVKSWMESRRTSREKYHILSAFSQ
jgi:hypothetical protein